MALEIVDVVDENPKSRFDKLAALYMQGATDVMYRNERYFFRFDSVVGNVGDRVISCTFTKVDEECPRLSGPIFAVFLHESDDDFSPRAESAMTWAAFGVKREFVEGFIDGFEG